MLVCASTVVVASPVDEKHDCPPAPPPSYALYATTKNCPLRHPHVEFGLHPPRPLSPSPPDPFRCTKNAQPKTGTNHADTYI